MAAVRSFRRFIPSCSILSGRSNWVASRITSPVAVCSGRLASSEFSTRCAYTDAAKKLQKVLDDEIGAENGEYKAPEVINKILKKGVWTFKDQKGDVNMALKREFEGKKVTVDFQVTSPFDTEAEGGNGESQCEMTDFSVTVESKDGDGVTFYCTTLQNDEKYRYMIGNVRYFANEEKDLVNSYSGPEFEDLDENVQEGLDECLRELGVDGELCDFIDAMSMHKEQEEYMRWLQCISKFLGK